MLARIFTILCLLLAPAAAAQVDRSVALVISVGEGHARGDAIQAQLQIVGTETLRAVDPNNAELRSVLQRFSAEALNADVGLVFLDAPVVDFDGRAFVLPAGVTFNRSSDIFTRAIPLSAFARATELAAGGGAVLAVAAPPPDDAPEAIGPVTRAPEALPGLSPILLATAAASETVVREIAAATRVETVEIGAIMERIAEDPGVSVSVLPRAPVYLREPAFRPPEPEPEPAPEPEATAPEPEAEAVALTLDELVALEKDLSRAAKRTLQSGLRREGFYSGFIDGIFGPQSREAITTFQEALGAEPTGYLSPPQMERLRAAAG